MQIETSAQRDDHETHRVLDPADVIEDRTLIIECPARCAERGCLDHKIGTWRKSKRLLPGTSTAEALAMLAAHNEEYPRSGPYRLAEYGTTAGPEPLILARTTAAALS